MRRYKCSISDDVMDEDEKEGREEVCVCGEMACVCVCG